MPDVAVRAELRWPRLALAVCLVVSVTLRIISLSVSPVTLDGDEAVTGIMVRRILAGADNYTYFAGQKYNGSLEQYLQAAMYAILPLPRDPFTLRLPQVAMTLATTYACYWLARLVLRSPWAAVFAAALYAAGPYFNVFSGTRTIGAYPSPQLIAVLGVIAVLKASGYRPGRQRVELTPRARDFWCAAAGLCAGLILWLSLTGLEVLAAAALWLVPVVFKSVRAFAAATAGIVVGAVPAVIWLVRNPGQLPGTGGAQPPTSFAARAFHLYDKVAGEFVGISGPDGSSWWWPSFAAHVVVVALGIVWLIWAYHRRFGLLDVLRVRIARREPIDLILLIFPFAIALYVISPYTFWVGSPRYLFALYPIFVVALAAAAAAIADRARAAGKWAGRNSVIAVAAIAIFALASISTLAAELHYLGRPTGYTTDAELKQAVRYLQSSGNHDVYAEYWTAQPAYYFATGTDVQVAAWDFGTRFPDVNAAVDHSPQIAYLTTSRPGDFKIDQLLAGLKERNVTYRLTRFGSATVVDQLSVAARPWEIGLVKATSHPA